MTAQTHPIDKELVMAYLDGELTPEQAARIAMHLDQCAECRELAADLRGVSSQMLAWSVEAAPKRLNDAVFEALRKSGTKDEMQIPRQDIPRKFAWKNLPRKRWAWAAVAFAVLCFVGYLAQRPRLTGMMAYQPGPGEAASQRVQSYGLADNLENEKAQIDENLVRGESRPPSGPLIARTASLDISVKDFNAARFSMDRVVREHQGYVSTLNILTEKGAANSLSAKLMIPAAQMDAALADFKALGRIVQEQQGGEEVTAQVVDLDVRLKNARETETQLADILRTRTGKIGDVLEVEKEMARVRGEIESMEAEQKQVHDRIAFASVELSLTEEYQAQLGGRPAVAGRQIRNALVDGYHAAADGSIGACVFLLSVGPSLLLWGLILFWPARWAWRRWQKSRAQHESRA
jgi:hypothetical protein